MKCEICDNAEMTFAWTDTHGIAQCFTCGAPYRLYFYEGEEGDKRRVDRAPQLTIKPKYVQPCRDYWAKHKRRMPSGFSMGYFGSRAQELATVEDAELFHKWLNHHNEYGSNAAQTPTQ